MSRNYDAFKKNRPYDGWAVRSPAGHILEESVCDRKSEAWTWLLKNLYPDEHIGAGTRLYRMDKLRGVGYLVIRITKKGQTVTEYKERAHAK